MRRIVALTTLLTTTLTLSSVARANEQTDRQAIANRVRAIMKVTVKDADYDVDKQQNERVINVQLTKQASNSLEQIINSQVESKLVGV